MLATGVLIFLLYDVIQKASEPINVALEQLRTQHTGANIFFLDVLLLIFGIGIGSVGLVYFNSFILKRKLQAKRRPVETIPTTPTVPTIITRQEPAPAGASSRDHASANSGSIAVMTAPVASAVADVAQKGELSAHTLAFLIAVGIGLHNFSEGLAIGQSAAVGAMQLAIVLIIGFGLHNMTEGFGIAGPLTGQSVSWKFIFLAGLIGGGPTFLGTAVGIAFHSPQLFLFCLALAAGAILYVVAELLGVARRFKSPEIVMWGLLVGFLLGYATDLVVTFAGA